MGCIVVACLLAQVRWRDTDIIKAQLDESQEVDAGGISKAFQNALLGRDDTVLHAAARTPCTN